MSLKFSCWVILDPLTLFFNPYRPYHQKDDSNWSIWLFFRTFFFGGGFKNHPPTIPLYPDSFAGDLWQVRAARTSWMLTARCWPNSFRSAAVVSLGCRGGSMWLSSSFGFASALSLSSVSIDHHDLQGQNAPRTVQTADGNFCKRWDF